jgi:hypothetical protein
VNERRCSHVGPNGRACRATPGRDALYCFVHNPEKQREAAEARRLGGLHRRRAKVLKDVNQVGGLTSADEIRRYLEVALTDGLALDNSVARGRLLIAGAMTATRLLETGELEARLTSIESKIDRLGEASGGSEGPA